MLKVVQKEDCLDLYVAEALPVGRGTDAYLVAEETHLAGREFSTPEEEVVAMILDELGYCWRFEADSVVERDAHGKILRETTADFRVLRLPVPIMLEVKRSKIGNRRQREMAVRAGFGFSYITGIMEVDYDARVRKVESAIAEAIATAPTALHSARSAGASCPQVETRLRLKLLRVIARAG
jgi:hypothetical protein